MEANDKAEHVSDEVLVPQDRSRHSRWRNSEYGICDGASTYPCTAYGPSGIFLPRLCQTNGVAKIMANERKTGLRSNRGRKESEEQLLQWWSDFKSNPIWGPGGVKVRDKSDGFNRYGIRIGGIPSPSEGTETVSEQRESQALHSRYAFEYYRPGRRKKRGS